MRTPYFEELCAEIRGIDLGDDERLRTRLAALLPTSGDDDAEPWLLLAVLAIRSGDTDEALAALDRAERAGAPPGATTFLRAHLLAQRGELAAAAEALDAAAAQSDEIAPADLLHARGALAAVAGDRKAAIAAFRAGLDDSPHDGARWIDLGRALAEQGDLAQAEAAFARALEEDEELQAAHYERATVWLQRKHIAEAAAALDELATGDGAWRERARLDPRWRSVRSDPKVAAVLSPPVRTPTWLDFAPPWLPMLARDADVARLGVEWVDAATSEALTDEIRRAHATPMPGTFGTAATREAAAAVAGRAIVVARGPRLGARDRSATDMLWLLDREANLLRLALSASYPGFTWIPAGRDAAGMRGALSGLVPQPFGDEVALHRCVRGFLGYRLRFVVPSPYSGELEPANAAELDRHFSASPFCEAGAWGSSCARDPWPEELPAQPQLGVRIAAQEQVFARQLPGRVWSLSRRTRHSRSILTIELHHRDVFVAMVRYAPAPHGQVIDAINGRFGTDYPRDLPLDALAALIGFRFDSAADLEAQLEDREGRPRKTGDEAAGLLQVVSALRYDDLSVTALYRRWLTNPDVAVRSTLYNIFVANNHESLLEEACLGEPDREIREQIEGILDEGIAPVVWDPLHDDELGTADEEAR